MYPTSRDVSRIKDTGGGRACQRDEATYPSCETGAGASRSGLVFGASEKARSLAEERDHVGVWCREQSSK